MGNSDSRRLPAACWQLVCLCALVTGCQSLIARPYEQQVSPEVISAQASPDRDKAPPDAGRQTHLQLTSAEKFGDIPHKGLIQETAAELDDRPPQQSEPSRKVNHDSQEQRQWRSVKRRDTEGNHPDDVTETRTPGPDQISIRHTDLLTPMNEGASLAQASRKSDRSADRQHADGRTGDVVPAEAISDSKGSRVDNPLPPRDELAGPALGMSTWSQNTGDSNHVPRELSKVSLPPYIIEPPDILLIEALGCLPDQEVAGEHLVRPDGTVGLGIYGSVHVSGLTLDEAKSAIEKHLAQRVKNPRVSVDVLAYNSKVYYVITDGGGYGEQVFRLPVTGNETVLDAISHISGLPSVASKRHIWIARPATDGSAGTQILPVNWVGITTKASSESNYQILPGDRIYVEADHWVKFDSVVAKVISPFERMLGFTLLGNTTVRSIQRGTNSIGQ